MTVGEYISSLLKQKGITVSELARRMRAKSRNVVYRIFDSYSGTEKQKRLIESIADAAEFTHAEREEIHRIMLLNSESRFEKNAREILLKAYAGGGGFSFIYNGRERRLSELLNRCRSRKTELYISNITNADILYDIKRLAEDNPRITIFYYARLRGRSMHTAYELLALLILSEIPQCKVFLNSSVDFSGVCAVTEYKNQKRLFMLEKICGEHIYFETNMNGSLARFTEHTFTVINNASHPIEAQSLKAYSGASEAGFYSIGNSDGCMLDNIITAAKNGIEYGNEIRIALDCSRLFDDTKSAASEEDIPKRLSELMRRDDIELRFLKDGLKANCSFSLIPSQRLMVYRTDFLTGENMQLQLVSNDVLEIMENFLNYVWNEMTLSDAESRELVRGLADED